MLSRDEGLGREQVDMDEGIFAGEMDGVPQASHAVYSSFAAPAMGSRTASSSSAPSPSLRPTPMPPMSNVKVQVTPPLRPEPMEAGGLSLSSSPLALGSLPRGQDHMPPTERSPPESSDDSHFPVISSSASSTTSAGPRPSNSPPVLSGSWTSKLKISPPMAGASATGGPVSPLRTGPGLGRRVGGMGSPQPGTSLLSASLMRTGSSSLSAAEQEEADLKLALELSLAESMSLEDAQ